MRELVVKNDCDRLMALDAFAVIADGDADDEPDASLRMLVFLRITWQSGDLGPTVVAR
jgi:hypothetical protein